MKELTLNFAAEIMLALAVLAFFVSFTMMWMLIARRATEQLENYKENFTDEASANASKMFMSVDPQRLFRLNLAALVIAPAIIFLLFRDVATTVAIAVAIVVLPSYWYRSKKARRLRLIEHQLPDALAMVAGSLRAGSSLNIALENLVTEQSPPLAQEFDMLLKEQRLGVELEVALANMEERIPLQDFSMLATALRINREVGGNLADTISSLGETLRRKGTMEGKIKSLTAQGQMQGYVMTGLPLLLGVLLNFLEPEAMSKLWTTGIGWAVMAVIVVMLALGYTMIKKITSIEV